MGRFTVFVPAVVALISGCQENAQCEKTRLEVNKSWSEVRQAAARRKQDGVDTPAWTAIESKAELLESSFVTRQVTWDSAERAGQAISAELPNLHADRDALLAGFRTSTESALKEQSDFEKQCR